MRGLISFHLRTFSEITVKQGVISSSTETKNIRIRVIRNASGRAWKIDGANPLILYFYLKIDDIDGDFPLISSILTILVGFGFLSRRKSAYFLQMSNNSPFNQKLSAYFIFQSLQSK